MRGRPTTATEPEQLEQAAEGARRLAVLLGAGLDPLSAVKALASSVHPLAVAAGCESPNDVPDAIRVALDGQPGALRTAWRLLSVQWELAMVSGAPVADALARTADALSALADAGRQADAALAGPLATARIVALLPLAGVMLGLAIGADPFGVLLGTVPGALAGLAGAALLAAGRRWNRRLVEAARQVEPLAGMGAELLAAALGGGVPPARAVELAEAAAHRGGLELSAQLEAAREVLDFAVRTGVPAAELLRAEAVRVRRTELADALRRAALLGSRLLAPLGLCFLPAFVLLGVVPLVVGILRDALSAF
ncbi:hypothetical protein [Homoserinibacter sp. GY 40078]|uniref:hypothetical protein n=1 Tax=Homoserinibacter sp. GY 40078 TaxID=2603275 RepID=UPI0011C7337A|nr:hypothetical protein [Homoserinibacter sp. GY 40078]TXK18457.1 hypothetical protein FVQ89_00370 [Homoserinibacter sp. GY 40078]